MPFAIVRRDITKMKVDAVVEAAAPSLCGGDGGCETGRAVISKGCRPQVKYVIRTAGPAWRGWEGREERELLASCYRESLALAFAHGCASAAVPLISSDAGARPAGPVMDIALSEIGRFLEDHEMQVYLVVSGHDAVPAETERVRDVQEYIDDVYARKHTDRMAVEETRSLRHKRAAPKDEAPLSPGPSGVFFALPREEGAEADAVCMPPCAADAAAPDWDTILGQTDEGFSEALLRMIDEKGMTDSECYKRANVDRKLFSKIRSNPAYRPAKPTVFAFCVALRLSAEETRVLLDKAGFSLSHASRFDIILEYFITHRIWDIIEINRVLFHYDMPLLGSGMK